MKGSILVMGGLIFALTVGGCTGQAGSATPAASSLTAEQLCANIPVSAGDVNGTWFYVGTNQANLQANYGPPELAAAGYTGYCYQSMRLIVDGTMEPALGLVGYVCTSSDGATTGVETMDEAVASCADDPTGTIHTATRLHA